MCVKSGELGGQGGSADATSKIGVGELLHDLEEKMEVARVQLQIVEALSSLAAKGGSHNRNEINAALAKLNSDLLEISQLFQDFAEPYNLWECQLSILHCAGHNDPMMVEKMWENIIEKELAESAELPTNSRVVMVSNKIKALGKVYSQAQKYFPIGKLCSF
jgi:nuclear pore complex protein Nup155